MAINEETVSILPFSSLSDRDFDHFPGNWSVPNLDEMNDLYNLLPNPDKTDQSHPDCSKYYSIKKLNYVLKKSGSSLFIFHCNTRSLSKNFNPHKEIWILWIRSLILGITEIKLNESSVNNSDLRNYKLFRTDSKTNAGGTALYIDNSLQAIPRCDIGLDMDQVESTWCEIDNGKNS